MMKPRIFWLTALAASLLCSLAALLAAETYFTQSRRAELEREAQKAAGLLVARISRYEALLETVRAHLAVDAKLPGEGEWATFVNSLSLDANFPGVYSLAVAGWSGDGRALHCPIRLTAPADSDGTAQGLDLCANQATRRLLIEAAQRNALVVSGLSVASHTAGSSIIVMYRPVQGPAGFLGWAAAPINVAKMIGVAEQGGYQLRLVSRSGDEVVYEPISAAMGDGLVATAPVQIGQSRWELQLHTTNTATTVTWLIAGGCGAGVLLIALWISGLRSSRSRAERMARDLAAKYRESEAFIRSVNDNVNEGIFRLDHAGRLVHINRSLAVLFGYSTQESMLQTKTPIRAKDQKQYAALMERLLTSGHVSGEELAFLRADGSGFYGLMSGVVVRDERNEVRYIDGAILDITERRIAEEKIRQLAYFDSLTKLPNRMLYRDRLEMALEHAKRNNAPLAVMFVDLDRFKQVNDTLGHDAGDALLKQVADRLRGCIRAEDTAARQGGDEFVLLLPNVRIPEDAEIVARKLVSAVSRPYQIEYGDKTATVHTSPSIGIASYPAHGGDAEALMKNADIAMYAAKNAGKNTYRFAETESENSEPVEG